MSTFVVLALCVLAASAKVLPKGDTPAEVVIHATNVTQVPSIHYIVDAVECLKEAYAVYSDPLDKAKMYSELFQEKHNESEWNVAVGYTAVHIKSQWYVETTVSEGGKNKEKKDSKKDTKYLIFSRV